MRFEDASWTGMEERLHAGEDRILLVLGATEEHADLSVCTDTLIPWEIASRAAKAENVPLAPAMPFGLSEWSMAYPGTISLRTSTLAAVLTDVVDSLLRTGFRSLFVINGHGVNRAVQPAFERALDKQNVAKGVFVQWWELPSVRALRDRHQLPANHAGALESFAFTRLMAKRSVLAHDQEMPDFNLSAAEIRAQLGTGHGPGPVNLPKGLDEEHVLEAAVDDVRNLLRDV